MRRPLAIITLALLGACQGRIESDRDPARPSDSGAGGPAGENAPDGAGAGATPPAPPMPPPPPTPPTASEAGPAAHIMTGGELCAHLQDVFTPELIGRASRVSPCFSAAQDATLGTFNTDDNDAIPFMDVLDGVDQDYLLIVWRFLARSCSALVTAELKAPTSPSNRLVEDAVPSVNRVNAFMSLMYGYDLGAGRLHAGAREYAALFARNVPAGAAAGTAARDYLMLCLSVGLDLRTFVR